MRDNNDKRMHGRGAQDNPNFNLDAVQSWKASEWEHITFVVNGQDKRITFYNDGAYKSSGGMSAPGSLSEGMMIGNDSELNDWGMDGKLDEIRFSPVMRSAEWIRFSYENQKAGADLFEFDNFQGPPYFGDAIGRYGKKGKLMSFNPPTFGTVENRTAVGLPAGLSYNTATGVISDSDWGIIFRRHDHADPPRGYRDQGIQGSNCGSGCLCFHRRCQRHRLCRFEYPVGLPCPPQAVGCRDQRLLLQRLH